MNPFEALVEPHRATLRLHCYRMLGSSHDSDDMVQETFVRAFRAQHTLEDPATARAWLHRIATNVCIDELAKRPRRARGPELGPPADPEAPLAARTPDAEWLEPAPSAWLSGVTPEEGSPAAQYTMKESVALAFVAALQVLTPPQRAVLLLRDVVGLSAAETAEALACSVSSANSTLHRARVAIEERVGPRAGWSPEAGPVAPAPASTAPATVRSGPCSRSRSSERRTDASGSSTTSWPRAPTRPSLPVACCRRSGPRWGDVGEAVGQCGGAESKMPCKGSPRIPRRASAATAPGRLRGALRRAAS